MSTTEAELVEIRRRLRRLEDIQSIQQLVASYGPLVDAGESRGAAALWSEQGTYEVKGFGLAQGRSQIMALFDGPSHQELIVQGVAHVLGTPQIEIDGDRAVALGHSVVFRHCGNAVFEVFRVAANRWELIRGGNGWQIDSRVNCLLNGDTAARALLLSSMRLDTRTEPALVSAMESN